MCDALPVSGVERIANLGCVLEYLIERQRPRERSALDELHHQVVRPDVINLADMWVIQRGDSPCLAYKAFGELFVDGLDGNHSIEPGIVRLINLTHAAGADRGNDFVGTKAGAGSQGQEAGIIAVRARGRDDSCVTPQ